MDADFDAWLAGAGGTVDDETELCMRTAWQAASERVAKIADKWATSLGQAERFEAWWDAAFAQLRFGTPYSIARAAWQQAAADRDAILHDLLAIVARLKAWRGLPANGPGRVPPDINR